jgi:hypothetical protein
MNELLTPSLAKKRAVIATTLFAAFGVVGAIVLPPSPFLPVAIVFYLAMLWNTYYSVKHFSSIVPPGGLTQNIIDGALAIEHAFLALSFDNPEAFNVVLVLLLGTATIKYVFALPVIEHPERLYRKIKIDGLGTIAAALALVGVALGFPFFSMVTWTVILIAMSFWIIVERPLYGQPDDKHHKNVVKEDRE